MSKLIKTPAVCLAALVVPALLLLVVGTGSAAAHAKSKGRGKKGKVLVHCASTTVKCHTHPGKQGPAGIPGVPGKAGALGAPGHGLAYQLRSAGPVVTENSGSTPVAVSPSSFNQPAGQDDQLLGEVTITSPSGECESGKAHSGHFEGVVAVDGRLAGIFGRSGSYTPGHVQIAPIVWSNGPEPNELDFGDLGALATGSSLQEHHVTVQLGSDNCEAAGATPFTVDSVAIDVLVSG